MKYPTVSDFIQDLETDPSDGSLVRGNPPGISAHLGLLLKDLGFEWMHNRAGKFKLVNDAGEPVLHWDKDGLRRGIAYREEIEAQHLNGKDVKRILDRCCDELE